MTTDRKLLYDKERDEVNSEGKKNSTKNDNKEEINGMDKAPNNSRKCNHEVVNNDIGNCGPMNSDSKTSSYTILIATVITKNKWQQIPIA